jgi:VIT1/CCC1 family predicted Fe2+/Mn2+ transporter
MTLITLFALGVIKSKFSTHSWWYSGIETCFLGAIVAAISYGIAVLIEPLAENF